MGGEGTKLVLIMLNGYIFRDIRVILASDRFPIFLACYSPNNQVRIFYSVILM